MDATNLFYKYRWLSKKIATQYYRKMSKGFMQYEDYFQAADIGLFKAASKYDNNKSENEFINYAKYYIEEEIHETYRKENYEFTISERDYDNIGSIMRCANEYCEVNNDNLPDIEYIKEKTGLSKKQIKQYHAIINRINHIQYISEENTIYAPYTVLNTKKIEKEELQTEINKQLSKLPENQVYVLKARYGFEGSPESLRIIGKKMGINHIKVKSIELNALRNMRNPKISKTLYKHYA